MATQRIVLTYKNYEVLPNDGRRYEIHEGELSVTPAPSPQHQIIVANLVRILDSHVRPAGWGVVLFAPLDVILSDTAIVQPDIVYLDPARLAAISRRGIEGVPTLLVEVLSPSTTLTDRDTKRQLYRRYGVPYYWIVDPEARAIEAYSLSEGEYQLVTRAAGTSATSLPPFLDLTFVPAALWP